MQMVTILNEFLVDGVGLDTICAESTGEELNKVVLELRGEIGNVLPGMLSYDQHLSQVGFGLGMALETIFISTLFLTDLTVPPQPLKALGLHLVGEVFRGTDFCARHTGRGLVVNGVC